jgi:tetratricopeptide (TPR) repeat protein
VAQAPAAPRAAPAAGPAQSAAYRPAPAQHAEPKTQPLETPIAAAEPSPPEQDHSPIADTGSAAPPGSSNFAGKAQVEHLLMEAEVRMTVSDYANAVKVYTKLVNIAPHVAAYRAKLALAMACYPRTAKQAEREFHEAVRLGPNDADIHYQFGLYYKAMKQRSRAVAEMRTAVRLNPRHRLAREELESLSPKDSALTSLKKLFK